MLAGTAPATARAAACPALAGRGLPALALVSVLAVLVAGLPAPRAALAAGTARRSTLARGGLAALPLQTMLAELVATLASPTLASTCKAGATLARATLLAAPILPVVELAL